MMSQVLRLTLSNDMGMEEEHQKWGVITNLLLFSVQAIRVGVRC